jgi:hypothetical protein
MAAIPWISPQARLIRLPEGQEERSISARLTSVKVEQLNTGVWTLDVSLVNLRHGEGAAEPGREPLPIPTVPPYLFDAFDLLQFGQELRIDVRYAGGTRLELAEPLALGPAPAQGDGFVPLIVARITGLQFAFSGVPTLQITGEDLSSLLKVKPSADKTWRDVHEVDIATGIVRDNASGMLGNTLGAAKVETPPFTATLRSVTQQKSQTHLAFLEEMAKRLDYELYVDFDTPQDTASALKLHFERARSQLLDEATLVDLRWGFNLLSFAPTLSVWDQYTEARAGGRNPSSSRSSPVLAGNGVVLADAPGEEGPFETGLQVRQRLGNNPHTINTSNLDDARRLRAAEAALLEQARKFLTATAEVVGLPSLRPGIHVRLKGLYPPFDGLYYVTRATHTLDGNGYRTSLALRRPGWTSPSEYARLVAPPQETT